MPAESASAWYRSTRPRPVVTRPRSGWLLVVARSHPRLLAELEAILHDHPRVQVIEDRRRGQALLPRCDPLARIGVSTN